MRPLNFSGGEGDGRVPSSALVAWEALAAWSLQSGDTRNVPTEPRAIAAFQVGSRWKVAQVPEASEPAQATALESMTIRSR
jgi:hypothetical protein